MHAAGLLVKDPSQSAFQLLDFFGLLLLAERSLSNMIYIITMALMACPGASWRSPEPGL